MACLCHFGPVLWNKEPNWTDETSLHFLTQYDILRTRFFGSEWTDVEVQEAWKAFTAALIRGVNERRLRESPEGGYVDFTAEFVEIRATLAHLKLEFTHRTPLQAYEVAGPVQAQWTQNDEVIAIEVLSPLAVWLAPKVVWQEAVQV